MTLRKVVCDTSVVIKFIRNDVQKTAMLDKIGFENLYISVVTLAEVLNGTHKADRSLALERLNKFNIIHFDKDISKYFKSISLTLLNKNNHIPIVDVIIASTALEYGFHLYTFNIKDFKPVPGLKLYKP
jgi:predicted nucleic acid-binding protein